LEESWNYQTGARRFFQTYDLDEMFPLPDTTPPIIHYTTLAKPWLCDYGKIPFEEIYWQYYCADWPEA
jgi:glycosyl transferase, family 8